MRACSIALILLATSWGLAAEVTVGGLESDIAWLINTERAQAGLPQLATNPDLAAVARAHSQEMMDRGYVGHDSPVADHKTPADRYNRAFDAPAAALAENVSNHEQIGLTPTAAQTVHTGFMNSPRHRANLMAQEVTEMGIGCAADAAGTIWTTEMFAKPGAPAPADTSSQATAPSATPATGAATRSSGGAYAPVTTRIWRVCVEPGAPAKLTEDIRAGEAVRVGVTATPSVTVSLSVAVPGLAGPSVVEGTSIHAAPMSVAPQTGTLTLEVRADQSADCRVTLVRGSQAAVAHYGSGAVGAATLAAGDTLTGSLGDGGSPQSFRVSEPGTLEVRLLDTSAPVTCAAFSADGELSSRQVLAGESAGAISRPVESGSVLVLTAPDARPGEGDYVVSLTARE